MAALGIKPAGGTNLKAAAKDAILWLLASRTSDGRIPYIIHPTDNSSVVFQPITYSTEPFIIADLRYTGAADAPLRAKLATLKSTVHWLAKNQNPDGSWGAWENKSSELGPGGFTPSGDAQRSPRAVSLLQWYQARVAPAGSPDPVVAKAIGKYISFLLNPTKMKAFGVAPKDMPHCGCGCNGACPPGRGDFLPAMLVSGFVGLAAADLIQPWSTFRL